MLNLDDTKPNRVLIKQLKVSGLLSFGLDGIDLPMRGLNVLIGPNGSGKSNLIEILALLSAAPNQLSFESFSRKTFVKARYSSGQISKPFRSNPSCMH